MNLLFFIALFALSLFYTYDNVLNKWIFHRLKKKLSQITKNQLFVTAPLIKNIEINYFI